MADEDKDIEESLLGSAPDSVTPATPICPRKWVPYDYWKDCGCRADVCWMATGDGRGLKLMYGLCDVKGCSEATYLGWRPLTERRGPKICRHHWCRYLDEKDRFDLFDEFKFRRPPGLSKPVTKKYVYRCACGRKLLPRRRFCTVCAAERERQRKKRAYHERKNPKPEPIVQENILLCRACGGTRKTGCTYCPKCSRERQRQANRERQRRHYRKTVKCVGLT